MHKPVEVSALTPTEQMKGFDPDDTRQLRQMAKEAQSFLLSFSWCKDIEKGWFGWGIGNVCAVFLFRITPTKKNVDKWLWVIVGDLPPAYLVPDNSPTPTDALEGYVELMQEWVDAARAGESVEGLIPVNAAPTEANAAALSSRLDFLRKKVLRLNSRTMKLDHK